MEQMRQEMNAMRQEMLLLRQQQQNQPPLQPPLQPQAPSQQQVPVYNYNPRLGPQQGRGQLPYNNIMNSRPSYQQHQNQHQ